MWDPPLSARHFTEAAQRLVGHIADRALDRGMVSGELTEATAGMLALLSLLRWERKGGLAALEKMGVDSDVLARELDAAIDEEGRLARRPDGTRVVVLPSGRRAAAVDTEGPRKPLLEQAEHEALGLGNDWVGTEHLLMASVRSACPRLADLLRRHGIHYDGVRFAVLETLRTF